LQSQLARLVLRMRALAKPASDALAGALTVVILKAMAGTDPDRMSAFGGRFMKRVGPWLPEHRTGRANLLAAFPEKTPAEVEDVLAGVWDNLGRLGAEYAHVGRIGRLDLTDLQVGRIDVSPESIDRFFRLRNDGKPSLLFAAHLANWELPAVVATANGLDTAILYRQPNIADIAEAIQKIRAVSMGELIATSGYNAVFKVAAALERGAHVAMLIDQHFSRGVDVTFFGRRCKANPLIARLAHRFQCPIRGVRAIRLPNNRFRVELTEAIEPVLDQDGKVDIAGTMQAITTVVEGWVREHPEQWLWLHRRWR
jgi:KDO2-lipid IV(A) lauroyltransferase